MNGLEQCSTLLLVSLRIRGEQGLDNSFCLLNHLSFLATRQFRHLRTSTSLQIRSLSPRLLPRCSLSNRCQQNPGGRSTRCEHISLDRMVGLCILCVSPPLPPPLRLTCRYSSYTYIGVTVTASVSLTVRHTRCLQHSIQEQQQLDVKKS